MAMLEPQDEVSAYRTMITSPLACCSPPLVCPQVQDVMQVDVGKQRRYHRPLGRAYRRLGPLSVLRHPARATYGSGGVSSRSAILCSTNSISHSWTMASKNPRMSASSTQFTFLCVIPTYSASSASMLAATRPEPVGETEKIRLVHRPQHLPDRSLNDLVFQRRHANRALAPVGLRDVDAPHRLRPVRSALDSCGQVCEACLQVLPVRWPRHAVHPRWRPSA